MSPVAEDPRQLAMQYEMVQRELARLDQHLATLQDALVETSQAVSTMEALAAGGEVEALVPVGAGVHVKATLRAGDGAILPVGAGYSTESKPDDVLAALRERSAQIQARFQETSARAQQMADAAAGLGDRLNSLGQPS